MKRAASAVLMAVSIATLAACATPTRQYVISTRDGHMEIGTTRPQAVPGTDVMVYWDARGTLRTIRQADYAETLER